MKKVFIINGHQYYPFAEGKLNKSLVEKASKLLGEANFEIKITVTQETYDLEEEIEKFIWADVIFLQMPLNWMGVTWSFKKLQEAKSLVVVPKKE